ncbi:MAG: zinc ribbon domain-containing protein [candidate division WOR-3 bacterium]
MKEHFANLRLLQELDNELKNLRERLNELPHRAAEIHRKLESEKARIDEKKRLLQESKKQYKLAEVELRSTDEKIASYSVQLYSAKDNVQYKALIKEIEMQKKVKNDIEDRILNLLEDAEKLEKELQELGKIVNQLEADAQQRLANLEAEKMELEKAIDGREKIRSETAAKLPPDLLRRYERIRASKGGIAVTSTENERCNGCLSPIPPQRLLEIDRQDKVYLCESCGRILLPVEKKPGSSNQ